MTGWIEWVIAQKKRGERAPRATTLPSTISAGGADDLSEKYEILDGGTNLATIGSSQAAPVVVDAVSISEQKISYALLYSCSAQAPLPFHPRTWQGLGYLGVSAGEL